MCIDHFQSHSKPQRGEMCFSTRFRNENESITTQKTVQTIVISYILHVFLTEYLVIFLYFRRMSIFPKVTKL